MIFAVAKFVDGGIDRRKAIAIGASWSETRSLIAPMSVENSTKFGKPEHQRAILRIVIELEDPEDFRTDLNILFNILSKAVVT